MSLSGSIEDLGVAELLYMVGISRRSGLLVLEDRTGEHRVLFRSGNIVAARDRRSPASLQELLVQRGVVDRTHLAVLERQARQQGRLLSEVLDEEGVTRPGRIDEELQAEVERSLEASLDLSDGTFTFELLSDPSTVEETFGGLVLDEGITPAKLPGVAERTKGSGLRGALGNVALPRTDRSRAIDLLVGESDISLPTIPAVARSTPSRSIEGALHPTGAIATESGPDGGAQGPVALLAIDSVTLARLLKDHLEQVGFVVRKARALRDATEHLRRALTSSSSCIVVADDSHPTLPGIELLARTKTLSRSLPVILVGDPRRTPAQRAAITDRAAGLGVNHVTLLAAAGDDQDLEEQASAIADFVRRMLVQHESQAAGPGPDVVPLAGEPAAPAPWMSGPVTPPPPLFTAPGEVQERRLSQVARGVPPGADASDVARVVLEIASQYLDRGVLLLRHGSRLRCAGAFAPAGGNGRSLGEVRRLEVAPESDALLAAPWSELRPWRGAPPAGAVLPERLGSLPRGDAVVLPLGDRRARVGLLYGDDAGGPSPVPESGHFQQFLREIGPQLAEALGTSERRAEARRRRATA